MIDIIVTGNNHSGKTLLLSLIAKTLSDNGFNNIVHISGHETTLEIFNTKADILKTEALEHVRNQEINLIEKHCSVLDFKKKEFENKKLSLNLPDPTTIPKIQNPCSEIDFTKLKSKSNPISVLLIIKGNEQKINIVDSINKFIEKFGKEDILLIALADYAFESIMKYSIRGNIILHVLTVPDLNDVKGLCTFIKELSPGILFNEIFSNFQNSLFEQRQLLTISEYFNSLVNLDIIENK